MYKITTRARDERKRHDSGMRQRFSYKELFKAVEKFEKLRTKRELKVELWNGEGQILEHN